MAKRAEVGRVRRKQGKEVDVSEPTEFETFDAVVRKAFSVPHDEIVKRDKEWKRKRKRARQKRAKKENG